MLGAALQFTSQVSIDLNLSSSFRTSHAVSLRVVLVFIYYPCFYVVFKLEFDVIYQFLFQGFVVYRGRDLNTPLQVSRHPVRGRYIYQRVVIITEYVDARMLQVLVDNAQHLDVLAELLHAGYETAYSADDHLYLHSGLTGLVQPVDYLLLRDPVELRVYIGVFSLLGVLKLVLDEFKKLVYGEWSNEKVPVVEGLIVILQEAENVSHLVLKRKDDPADKKYALIEVPADVLPRFNKIPGHDNETHIIMLDDIIRFGMNDIFSMFDYDDISAYTLKMTHDSELDIESDITTSFF